MPSNSYHCKYCHRRQPTETALNRHIAHSTVCFQAWRDDLLKLSSGNVGSMTRRAATMDGLMPLESSDNSNVDVDLLIPDNRLPARKKMRESSYRPFDETDEAEDVNDAHSQSRYRIGYSVGYPIEILGQGMTKFRRWQEEQSLNGTNEWTPFQNQKEWELAKWLIKNVGQKSMDEFLKLPIVSIYMPILNRIITNLCSDSRACRSILPQHLFILEKD